MPEPANVVDATFEAEVLKSDVPVLVDFHATWCGPCKFLAPIVEEVALEYAGKLKVMKLDIDESQDTAVKFGIMGVPTLVVFRAGAEVARIVGAIPKRVLTEQIDKALS